MEPAICSTLTCCYSVIFPCAYSSSSSFCVSDCHSVGYLFTVCLWWAQQKTKNVCVGWSFLYKPGFAHCDTVKLKYVPSPNCCQKVGGTQLCDILLFVGHTIEFRTWICRFHLLCFFSGRRLRGKAFYNVNGKVYCEEDFLVSHLCDYRFRCVMSRSADSLVLMPHGGVKEEELGSRICNYILRPSRGNRHCSYN